MNTSSSRVFDLIPVIDKLHYLDQGEKIETLHLSVGCLYVGTSHGSIVQFSISETSTDHGVTSLQAEYLGKTCISDKNNITFIHAAPNINRMLVMSDGTLHILNMSDLTILPMAASNKLKGLSAVCVNFNQVQENPFSVEICVAKKKQCQIAVLSLTEEKMSVWRTRDSSESVTSVAMSGVFICAALASQYVVYNMENMTMTPLFPIDPSAASIPNILSINSDEFLIQAPGNLGMFVTSAGVAGRPPLQWSSTVTQVTYSPPYLICLESEMVSVYDVTDQVKKQGISFRGAKYAVVCDGHILMSSSSAVHVMSPIPWSQQAMSMIESGQLDEAVNLASNKLEDGDVIMQKVGFKHLKNGEFDKAEEYLLRGNTDVRELLCLYQGMLPSKCKFVRSEPPLHDIPDMTLVNTQNDSMSPDQFLVKYLQSLIVKHGSNLAFKDYVHTALVKILTTVNPSGVVNVINDENSDIDYEELIEFFEEGEFHHFLASLHWRFEQKDAAVETWCQLLDSKTKKSFDEFPGLRFFCAHLSLCSNEVVLKYGESCLQKDPLIGVEAFRKTNLDLTVDREYVENVLIILEKYQSAKIEFLKFLIFERNSQEENHHTQLAVAFITAHRDKNDHNQDYSTNLSKLILSSEHLNANFLLEKLSSTDLNYQKAILHGKLGENEKALDILVNSLHDYALAEKYCDDMSKAKSVIKSKLLLQLLTLYLHPRRESDKENFTSLAVDLINSRACDMNGSRVIAMLPEHWNISIILPALRTFSRSILHSKRMTSVKKNLQQSSNNQLLVHYIKEVREPIHVITKNFCPVCQKYFTEADCGKIARFPNGVIVHDRCVVNKHICPVTGTVFKLLAT